MESNRQDNRSSDDKRRLHNQAFPEGTHSGGTYDRESGEARTGSAADEETRRAEAHPGAAHADDRPREDRLMSVRTKEYRSFASLFSSLTRDVMTLGRQEMQLAKAEASQKMSQAVSGVAFIAIAAAVSLAGLIILLQAAVYGLNIWLPSNLTPWLSALIVGGVVVLIGLIMVLKGRSNLKANNLMPDRTVESIKRDRDFVRKQTS